MAVDRNGWHTHTVRYPSPTLLISGVKHQTARVRNALPWSAVACLAAAVLVLIRGVVITSSVGCFENNHELLEWVDHEKHLQEARSSYYNAKVVEQQKKHNFTVAACIIVKDSEAYLAEWLDYHIVGLGFDMVYIYDNSEGFDMEIWYKNTRSHPVYSKVEVQHFPDLDTFRQIKMYTQCIQAHGSDVLKTDNAFFVDNPQHTGKRHEYFALFDVDEFIVLQQPERHAIIHDVLDEYLVPFGGALTMNWMLVGTGNRTVYSPLPVLKRFVYRDPKAFKTIKTIVKASDFRIMRSPHSVAVARDKQVSTTALPGQWHNESKIEKGAFDTKAPSNVMLLFHYRYLSVKEYTQRRCFRKEVDGIAKGCKNGTLEKSAPAHLLARPGTVRDTSAWDFLVSRVPKYGAFNKDEWEDYT